MTRLQYLRQLRKQVLDIYTNNPELFPDTDTEGISRSVLECRLDEFMERINLEIRNAVKSEEKIK